MLNVKDLYWTAGFLEGEGCFRRSGNTIRVTADQVQKEPVDRLFALFGGTVRLVYSNEKRLQFINSKPRWRWYLNTMRSAALMMTLYSLMSPKRKREIEESLIYWKTLRHQRQRNSHYCSRGHDLRNPENVYMHEKTRSLYCKQCRQAADNRAYQKKKLKERFCVGVISHSLWND